MKTYTFKNGLVLTEQKIISILYRKHWKLSYTVEYNFREDLYLLFSALDKFKHLCDDSRTGTIPLA